MAKFLRKMVNLQLGELMKIHFCQKAEFHLFAWQRLALTDGDSLSPATPSHTHAGGNMWQSNTQNCCRGHK